MKLMSGMDYLRIDIANQYGLDKQCWEDRILFTINNNNNLESIAETADEPYLFAKAVMAYRNAQNHRPIGHVMSLDATASFLQIMACLSGCHESAKYSNLINTGSRIDLHTAVANDMNSRLPIDEYVVRKDVKKPITSHYYCKASQLDSLSELQNEEFYNTLGGLLPGAEEVKEVIREFWDPTALAHSFKLPDGHTCRVPVTEMVDSRVEISEIKNTFTYRYLFNQPSMRSVPLVANVIQGIDAYIARQMVRMAHQQGFQLVHIHDCFLASPQYFNKVRMNYIQILCDIADSNLLADILSQLKGSKVYIDKTSNDLSKYIKESEYALS